MKRLYPEALCYQNGYLDVGNGYSIYFEQCGNPEGIPILFLHGGPGAGLPPNYTQFFNRDIYRIIGFDQRGCGRSTRDVALAHNTTANSISDIEALRKHLDIEQWAIFGGSWGATLGLCYAISHSTRVTGIVLRGVFLGRAEDREWYLASTGGPAQCFPEYYQELTHDVLGELSADNVSQYYLSLLTSSDVNTRDYASLRWYCWEERLSKLSDTDSHIKSQLSQLHTDVFPLAVLECHYLVHHCFIDENYILENTECFSHIPGFIIHGRYDMICKTQAAAALNSHWTNSQLKIVSNAGHSTSEPGIAYALCRATRELASIMRESNT